jgi:hypothetical protein
VTPRPVSRLTLPRHRRGKPAMAPWSVAWLGGALIGVANGVVRETTFGKRAGETAAHQISVLTAIAAFAGYFSMLQRRWPIRDADEALKVGSVWLGLTVGFEFGFGRLVARKPWNELLADYNLFRGRLWPLVLMWLAAGPEITRRWQPHD